MQGITTICAREEKFFLASLKRSELPQVSHQFLQLFLIERERDDFFFSFTETEEEISLILDEHSAQIFSNSVKMEGERRRAFHFSLSSCPYDTGIISEVTLPLSRASIDIFYFTSFNSDFIFVKESKFEEAKKILRSSFPSVWVDDDSTSNENIVKIDPPSDPQAPISPNTTVNWKLLQSFPNLPIVLSNLDTNHEGHVSHLLKLLFFPKNTRRFVSLTHIDQEISLIWDTETFHNFDQTYLLTTLDEVWIPIKRVAKQGFQETGVVSAIVTPLKKFSILYLSSFSTSYFLVRQKEYPSCLQTLTNNQFQILEAKK